MRNQASSWLGRANARRDCDGVVFFESASASFFTFEERRTCGPHRNRVKGPEKCS